MPISERALGKVTIMNYGDYNLQYQWILSEECTATGAQGCQLVSIDRAEGSVEAQDRTNCELVFAPPRKMTLKNCTLTLKVNSTSIAIISHGSCISTGSEWSNHSHMCTGQWSGAKACLQPKGGRLWHVFPAPGRDEPQADQSCRY